MTNQNNHPHTMRLQRFLARSGVSSRRGAEALMTAGRVTVNGHIASELGTKVDTENDRVEVDGNPITFSDAATHIMLYKPKGYLSTMKDPKNRPCVADLVDTSKHPGLFCVGRLDKDTTGLLLFTTDGDLAQNLLHPKYEKEKVYQVLIQGQLNPQDVHKLETGIELEDGLTAPTHVSKQFKLAPELLVTWKQTPNTSAIEITIHEGKKHLVKRMFEAVGHLVIELHRSQFGPLVLSGLKPGGSRELTQEETRALERGILNPHR